MATLKKTKQSRLEKLIGNKIKKAKPKHEKPGYIKQLVLNQFKLIEDALDRGCDFDDLADVISSEIGREVNANTLKRYHVANRRALQGENSTDKNSEYDENKDRGVPPNKTPSMLTTDDRDRQPKIDKSFSASNSNQPNTQDKSSEEGEKTSLRDKLQNSPLDSDLFGEEEDLSDYNIY